MRAAIVAAMLLAHVLPVAAQGRPAGFTQRAPLPPGLVEAQVMGGISGLAIGGLAGGLAGAALTKNSGPGDLAGFIGGLLLGSLTGTTVGVHVVSRRAGVRSNPLATFGGSLVGLAGGPLLFVTVPIGGTIGHNVFRK